MAFIMKYHLSFILMLASLFSIAISEECVYVIKVETGDYEDAGTSAKIDMKMSNKYGKTGEISNLEDCLVKSGGGEAFMRGKSDDFLCQGECIDPAPCLIKVYSDGEGSSPDWYCASVNVEVLGHVEGTKTFTVNHWLSRDKSPSQLYAIKNECGNQKYMWD